MNSRIIEMENKIFGFDLLATKGLMHCIKTKDFASF